MSGSEHGPAPALGRVGWRPCSYDPKVFSPRIRAVLPARYLADAGVEARIVPPDGSGDYDCVVFQKAYAKRDLELAERLKAGGTRLVLDLCDNHFYNPDDDPLVAERVGRLRRMVDLVDAVTVSSVEIGKLFGAKPTFAVDDALELLPFTAAAERAGQAARRARRRWRRPTRLVWHGQSGTEHLNSGLAPLGKLLGDLEQLHAQLPLSLTVVSNSRKAFKRHIASAAFPTRFIPWRARTFAMRFAQHDICLLPIERNPFTICKTNNRTVTSLLLGVPVIADEIPSYQEFRDCMLFGDWTANIRRYVDDPALAQGHVRAAQQHIARTYTKDHVVSQWRTALEAVLRENVG